MNYTRFVDLCDQPLYDGERTMIQKVAHELKVSTVQRLMSVREGLLLYFLVLVGWGLYRLLFRLPVVIEEVGLKAIVFGLPVLLIARKRQWKGKDLGLTGNNLTASVYLGVLLGIFLGLAGNLGNLIRHQGIQLSAYGLTSESVGGFLILSMVTAFWEQLLFCGLFLRLWSEVSRNEWLGAWVVAILYLGLNLPALWFIQRLAVPQLIISMLLLTLLQWGNVVLMLRYKNLAAPMMAQALWGVTVFLFR